MKASEARKIAETQPVKGMKTLHTIIRNVATNGDTQTTVSVDLIKGPPKSIIKQLVEDGYMAEYVCDQRDGDYYKISW